MKPQATTMRSASASSVDKGLFTPLSAGGRCRRSVVRCSSKETRMAGRARQGLRTAWKSPWTGSAARASDKASDKLILMLTLLTSKRQPAGSSGDRRPQDRQRLAQPPVIRPSRNRPHPTMIEPASPFSARSALPVDKLAVDRCGPSCIRKPWTGRWRSRPGKRDD